MPLALALVLFGSVVLVAGWKDQPLLDTLLGRAGEPITDGSPNDFGGSDSGNGTLGSGAIADVAGEVADAADAVAITTFDGIKIAGWIKKYLVWARKHGWTGTIDSGYRSYADQKRIYDSGVRPAAVPGTSNHEGAVYPRGAVDVGDGTAQQLADILKHYPGGSLLVYAGKKDPVHFSHPHNGAY